MTGTGDKRHLHLLWVECLQFSLSCVIPWFTGEKWSSRQAANEANSETVTENVRDFL